MKEYEIHLNDWSRIFVGNAPPAFYAELVFRAVFLFLLLIVSMRILGKRMAAQLSRNEMAALVSLAAAIGVPMVSQDRGILPSMIIAFVVILISKISAKVSFENKKVENLMIGDVSVLIENGVINKEQLNSIHLPKERIMAQLRNMNIVHLGEVKRLYMESTGTFSLIKNERPTAGLLTIPRNDQEFVEKMVDFSNEVLCSECGEKQDDSAAFDAPHCKNCNNTVFTMAVVSKP